MRKFWIIFGLTLAALMKAAAVEPGETVVVVYNSAMAGSKLVAEHYAAIRHVPGNQVVGFEMSTVESMWRSQYREQLEEPLLHFLEAQNLLNFENSADGMRKAKPTRIRYIVLCYGVPLRIAGDKSIVEPREDKLRPELRRNGACVDSELCFLPWPDPHRMLAAFTPNPFYGATNPAVFNPTNGLFIVTRLDGPSVAIATGLVDKAAQAERDGLWGRAYFDMRGLPKGDALKSGDDWIGTAAIAAHNYGFETIIDNKPELFSEGFPMSQIALYAGWYSWKVCGPFAQSRVEFMPGAFAYHLHSFSAQTLRSTNSNWCGPLLADGVTATMGCIDEPYLDGTPNIGIFFTHWLAGFTFGEAAYASEGALSWQTTVIGDPLYRPFGRDPRILHESLRTRHSPMFDWSNLRVVDLSLNQGVSPEKLIGYIQTVDTNEQSAVLTEKLGDLYLMQGDSSSAINSWRRALTLRPTPLQAARLVLELGDKLAGFGQEEQALDLYDAFLQGTPNYPDALALYKKMEPIARNLRKFPEAERYAREITRLSAQPAP